jgi:hypothetical protein
MSRASQSQEGIIKNDRAKRIQELDILHSSLLNALKDHSKKNPHHMKTINMMIETAATK